MEIKNKKSKGFTLVEVITVVAILLILAAFAVPEAMKAKPNFQLRSLAHDVLAVMQKARSLAVQHNTSVCVAFDGNGYQLVEDVDDKDVDEKCEKKALEEGDSGYDDLPKYADYGDATRILSGKCGGISKNWEGTALSSMNSITFNSRGSAGAGTIYFDNGREEEAENQQCYAVTVINTGAVKLRKFDVYSDDEDKDKDRWLD